LKATRTEKAAARARGSSLASIEEVLADAAQDVLARLMNKYLPAVERGYVGDASTGRSAEPHAAPHRVLGLATDASPSDIRRRLRQLSKIFHPDVEGGNAEKMTEINEAVAALLKERSQDIRR